MTKTGRRDENIDFWWNLTKLQTSGFVAKVLTKICTFWRTKNSIFGGKILWSLVMLLASSSSSQSCFVG